MRLCDPKPLWEEEEVGCCRQSSKVSWSPLRQASLLFVKLGEGQQVVRLWRHVQLPPSPLFLSLTPCLKQKTGLLPQQDSTFTAKFLQGTGRRRTSLHPVEKL